MRSPLSFCKTFPLFFSMVHLLHRSYGVDAPESIYHIRSAVSESVAQSRTCRFRSENDETEIRLELAERERERGLLLLCVSL